MKDSGFASVYSKWTENHDEKAAIAKRNKSEEKSRENIITIGELRRMKVQDELDLHNYTLEEALHQIRVFVGDSIKSGLRKVRIVTGKGLHSPDGVAVLRPAVISALKSDNRIREIDLNPKPQDGGSGAVILILKKKV